MLNQTIKETGWANHKQEKETSLEIAATEMEK